MINDHTAQSLLYIDKRFLPTFTWCNLSKGVKTTLCSTLAHAIILEHGANGMRHMTA